MYADDMLLISENVKDLQVMLDVVINEQKSKIMHFGNKVTPMTKVDFTYAYK